MRQAVLALTLIAIPAVSSFAGGPVPADSFYALKTSTLQGQPADLGQFMGKVTLVVNVASQCGNTPQYAGLQKLYDKYGKDGFVVLGVPANEFGKQEPGTDEEIAEFCDTNYHVTFPVFSKISVVGDDQHPLYRELTTSLPRAEGDPDAFRERLRGFGMTPNEDPDILWNFEKFLIAKDGTVARRFAPTMTPDDPIILAAIEEELAR